MAAWSRAWISDSAAISAGTAFFDAVAAFALLFVGPEIADDDRDGDLSSGLARSANELGETGRA
jgi:hypothetical protein